MTALRIWLTGTGVFIAGWLIWAFVPVLVPMIAVTMALGVLVWVIVKAARALERRLKQPQ